MAPMVIEHMLYLGIPFANQGSMSSLLIRIQYQRAVVSKCNFVVWSTISVFSEREVQVREITFTLHWLAAGADFE